MSRIQFVYIVAFTTRGIARAFRKAVEGQGLGAWSALKEKGKDSVPSPSKGLRVFPHPERPFYYLLRTHAQYDLRSLYVIPPTAKLSSLLGRALEDFDGLAQPLARPAQSSRSDIDVDDSEPLEPKKLPLFRVEGVNGGVAATYHAKNERGALDAMARTKGYMDYADVERSRGPSLQARLWTNDPKLFARGHTQFLVTKV